MAMHDSFIADPPPLHRDIPNGFALNPHEVVFDPAVHLQIEPPKCVVSSEFDRYEYPPPYDGSFNLGYAEPFRLLSDEGARALRAIVDANEKYARSNERTPKCMRDLGYRSQFARDLAYNSDAVDFFSHLAGKPLTPHAMTMNLAQVNFGRKIDSSHPALIVDEWHVDSVDYVVVIILSDLSRTVGGELQVLHKHGVRDNKDFMEKGVVGDDEALIESVKYPGMGYAVFMHGSAILHRIAPVLFADEPRVSYVTSYMSRDVYDYDTTRYYTFKEQDPEHITDVEFARHQAWRVKGRMEHMIKDVPFGTPSADLVKMMRESANALERAARLMEGTELDRIDFIDSKKLQSKL